MLRWIIIIVSISFASTISAQRYYIDTDRDGYGNMKVFIDTMLTSPPIGYVTDSTDCDDSDNLVFPGAQEICDSIDQDCDGALNNNLATFTYFRDVDRDGFGNAMIFFDTCRQASYLGWVINDLDCDDTDPNISPAANEIPGNGIDDDCDGVDLITTFNVFPNPFVDEITIHYPSDERINLLIHDFSGKTIFEREVEFQDGVYQIQLPIMAEGIYLVRGYKGLDDELFARKIRKQ